MKRIFILLALFCALHVHANDTLTRAQVYNFNVGDTFDYSNYYYNWDYFGPESIITDSTTYSRYVITGIYYSLDSSAKYIQRTNLFPNPYTLDTLILQNLSDYEVYLDTTSQFNYWSGFIGVNSSSQCHGRTLDTLFQVYGYPGWETLLFADGLGEVLNYQIYGGGGNDYTTIYSTSLIYYSKGTETWGTPYYYSPSWMHTLDSSGGNFILAPTLNNGAFSVNMTDESLLPVTLMIYDMSGKKTEQITLDNLVNNINIGSHSAGVYVWQALSKNQLIQTGKMVLY